MTLHLSDIHITVTDGPESLNILDGVDLDVDAGEFVAVAGASGSGKSTLVAIAGLLRRPDRGRITIAGNDVSDTTDRRRTAIRRQHIGLVFQNANLFPSLTAVEQLELVAHLRGRVRGQDRRRAQNLLDEVGLADRVHHRPAQLSGGERQRVAIARALMAEPSIVLADEPTAALDDARGWEVMTLLAALSESQGTATLVVTHALHQLPQITRCWLLELGQLRPRPSGSDDAADPRARGPEGSR